MYLPKPDFAVIAFIVDTNLKSGETLGNASILHGEIPTHRSSNPPTGLKAPALPYSSRDASFTFGHMERWWDILPGAGSYLGESNVLEPNFQQGFYGAAYKRLLIIKKRFGSSNCFLCADGSVERGMEGGYCEWIAEWEWKVL
jgi:hypothetical protein